MRPSDSPVEAEVRASGYSVQPFLDADDIRELSNLHRDTIGDVPSDYFVSAFSSDLACKRRIFEGIVAVCESKLGGLLPNYRIVMGSFVTKRANSTAGRLGLHQDYTMVDHANDLPINIWCPLVDVDSPNGCLKIVEGSQRVGHISATPPNPGPHDDLRPLLESECMKEIPQKGGTAFVFDTRLFHATEENVTDCDRTAVFLNLVPTDTQPRVYVWDKDVPAKLAVYEVDEEFLLELEPNTFPPESLLARAKRLEPIDYRFEPFTERGLLACLDGEQPAAQKTTRQGSDSWFSGWFGKKRP